MKTSEKVYIRLIDGVETYVPVDAKKIAKNTYLITKNDQLDLIDDATSIWEFFPADIVSCRIENNQLYASSLIESNFPNRRLHTLIFHIVISLGKLSDTELRNYTDEIQTLRLSTNIAQRKHPIVDSWIKSHY